MEIVEIRREPIVIVEPRGRIDTAGAKPFGDRLVELIHAGSRNMLVDLQHVIYIGSAGFRALLIAGKLAEERSAKLVLCGLSAEIKRLFEIATFTDLFTICASREDGMAKAQ
jgi:anti-sigma B factor antagonist